MNVDDLFYQAFYNDYNLKNFKFVVEDTGILGFLLCNREYMPVTLPISIVNDICDNNTEYIKCVYCCSEHPYARKTTLSVFTYLFHESTKQLNLAAVKFKDDKYYIGSGLVLDCDKNILLSVCTDSSKNNKLVVSPSIYNKKTTFNKYIISKIIPTFCAKGMEIDIKHKDIMISRCGLSPEILTTLNSNVPNYKFCGLEN